MNHPPDYGHLTWIGTILGPHGLKGEVRVRPLTDTPDYYLQEKEFLLESGEGLKRVEVKSETFGRQQRKKGHHAASNRLMI